MSQKELYSLYLYPDASIGVLTAEGMQLLEGSDHQFAMSLSFLASTPYDNALDAMKWGEWYVNAFRGKSQESAADGLSKKTTTTVTEVEEYR